MNTILQNKMANKNDRVRIKLDSINTTVDVYNDSSKCINGLQNL